MVYFPGLYKTNYLVQSPVIPNHTVFRKQKESTASMAGLRVRHNSEESTGHCTACQKLYIATEILGKNRAMKVENNACFFSLWSDLPIPIMYTCKQIIISYEYPWFQKYSKPPNITCLDLKSYKVSCTPSLFQGRISPVTVLVLFLKTEWGRN